MDEKFYLHGTLNFFAYFHQSMDQFAGLSILFLRWKSFDHTGKKRRIKSLKDDEEKQMNSYI